MEVCVIGAGAAGLMAAVSAAKSGAAVTVLESMDKPGKKISITGNGRCNLTNRGIDVYKRQIWNVSAAGSAISQPTPEI